MIQTLRELYYVIEQSFVDEMGATVYVHNSNTLKKFLIYCS